MCSPECLSIGCLVGNTLQLSHSTSEGGRKELGIGRLSGNNRVILSSLFLKPGETCVREVGLVVQGVEKGGEESATAFQCWSTGSDVGWVNVLIAPSSNYSPLVTMKYKLKEASDGILNNNIWPALT